MQTFATLIAWWCFGLSVLGCIASPIAALMGKRTISRKLGERAMLNLIAAGVFFLVAMAAAHPPPG